jgi:hypothetical protein
MLCGLPLIIARRLAFECSAETRAIERWQGN